MLRMNSKNLVSKSVNSFNDNDYEELVSSMSEEIKEIPSLKIGDIIYLSSIVDME